MPDQIGSSFAEAKDFEGPPRHIEQHAPALVINSTLLQDVIAHLETVGLRITQPLDELSDRFIGRSVLRGHVEGKPAQANITADGVVKSWIVRRLGKQPKTRVQPPLRIAPAPEIPLF